MKKKNKRVVRYKSHINLNAGIVIFGLISIYLLINIVIYFTTERTAFYEVISGSNAQEANVSYNGIAIRNEIVQSAQDSGYIDYYVREGSRVSLNTTLYSIDSTGELNTLLSEASKKNPKLSSDNIDTLAGLISDYCNNYDEMNYSEIYNFKTSLKGTVVDLINMNSLENIAKEEGNTFSINNSASTGIVLYRIDNYENLKPKNLKASLFDKNSYVDVKFSSGIKTEKGNPIYKTVSDEEWSIAVQFTKKEAKKYKKVNGVKIKFLKDGLTTTANIIVVKGQDRKYYGIITLSKYMIRYVTDRFVNIQIIDDVSKGLKIPKTSLVSKSLYVIPKSYGAEGGNSDKIGFNRQVKIEGKITNEFYYPTIAYSDKDNYYVSTALFENGDVLTAIDSSEQYIIGKTQDFVGVYNINNGYTVFVRVNILESTDEYYIVKQGDIYGLSLYDRIVLDGSTVSENQIIFQ